MKFWRAIDLGESITVTVSALKAAPLPLLIAGLIMSVLSGGSGGGPVSPGGGGGGGGGGSSGTLPDPSELSQWFESQLDGVNLALLALAIGLLLLLGLCAGLLWAAFSAFLQVGWIRMHEQVLVTGTTTLSTLFSAGSRFRPMFGYTLLTASVSLGIWTLLGGPWLLLGAWAAHAESLPAGIAALILLICVPMIPYIWWQLSAAFGPHAIALDGETVRGALRRSMELARGNRLNLLLWGFVMRFLAGMLSMMGLVACCVGMLVTVPAAKVLTDLPFTRGYLLLSRGEDELQRLEGLSRPV